LVGSLWYLFTDLLRELFHLRLRNFDRRPQGIQTDLPIGDAVERSRCCEGFVKDTCLLSRQQNLLPGHNLGVSGAPAPWFRLDVTWGMPSCN